MNSDHIIADAKNMFGLPPLSFTLVILDDSGSERRVPVQADRAVRVAKFKDDHLFEYLIAGWKPRCFYQGKPLSDSDKVSHISDGSCVHVYLQRCNTFRKSPASTAAGLNGGATRNRQSPSRRGVPRIPHTNRQSPRHQDCVKRHDFLFNAVFAVMLSFAWMGLAISPASFDGFSCFAIGLFSIVWAVSCWTDMSSLLSSSTGVPVGNTFAQGIRCATKFEAPKAASPTVTAQISGGQPRIRKRFWFMPRTPAFADSSPLPTLVAAKLRC